MNEQPTPPLLRVIRGDATPEEVAALVAVLAASAPGAVGTSAPPTPSRWVDRVGHLRRPLEHGPGAWRASALPR